MNKKLKFKDYTQVWIGFTNIDSWLRTRKKKTDMKCGQCGRQYSNIKETDEADSNLLALMGAPKTGKENKIVCASCGRRYIDELNAKDIREWRQSMKNEKDTLISSIESMIGEYHESKYNRFYGGKELSERTIDELKDIHDTEVSLKEERDRIAAIPEGDGGDIDDYLVEEYGVVYDPKYLKDPSQIEEYFKEDGRKYFDCGQGYYKEEASVIAKILDRYYSVTMYAEIGNAKQDIGDRLYWVEAIESVEYTEIDKPKKKERVAVTYEFDFNVDEYEAFKSFIDKYTFTKIA